MVATDPVCKMTVEEEKAAASYRYGGQSYYFCAQVCRDRFAKNPERFLNGQPAKGPENPASEPDAVRAGKIFRRIDLPIRGMSCASCVEKVETGLSRLEGVKEASVNFASEKGTVLYDPSRVSIDRIIKEIDNIGYATRTGRDHNPRSRHVLRLVRG